MSAAEAGRRLAREGPNEPPTVRPRSAVARVGDQLRDPMILLLQGAAVLSALLRDWSSTAIIAAVVVFNTAAGVVQQYRADRVMTELHRLAAPTARVRRDGVLQVAEARLLVVGDEVVLTAGDLVPADASVVEAHDLEVDESPVTGESLPVPRGEQDDLLAGTRVTRGRAVVHLTRTGPRSSLGRTAALLVGVGARPTPLQRRLTALSRALVVLVVSLTVVVVALGVSRGRPWGEMVLVGLSLTVAALPESLPAVVTIALALGAHRMAERHVIVRSLPAVETLGSVTVVATDKTGTITEGRMEAQVVWVDDELLAMEVEDDGGEGRPRVVGPGLARLLRDLVLCNDADWVPVDVSRPVVTGDPLEGALLTLAARQHLDVAEARAQWPREGEVPFDHASRTMTTWHRGIDGRALWVCKGAPEAVLAIAGHDAGGTYAGMLVAAEEMATDGLRVLAVADSDDGRSWCPVGLVGIGDPPRASAEEVVASLLGAGIRVVLVSGDHLGTARAIARRVGIAQSDDPATEGRRLADVPPERRHRLAVVARVLPEQKVHVVEWLQAAGEVVAMLGDGVNDAPALRRADIGVAQGQSGSAIAREAADLVLADDELGSVVAAVEEGRRIYANIRSFLLYAVSGGLAEVGVMVAGGLVGLPVPLLPGQILWVNLLTHGVVGVAFGSEPLDPAEMARPPRPPAEPIFTRAALVRLAWVTAAIVGCVLVVIAVTPGTDDARRTAAFLAMGGGQLGVALALRADRRGTRLMARGLELAVLVAVLLMAAAVTVPALELLLGTRTPGLRTVLVATVAGAVPGVALRVALRVVGRVPVRRARVSPRASSLSGPRRGRPRAR